MAKQIQMTSFFLVVSWDNFRRKTVFTLKKKKSLYVHSLIFVSIYI